MFVIDEKYLRYVYESGLMTTTPMVSTCTHIVFDGWVNATLHEVGHMAAFLLQRCHMEGRVAMLKTSHQLYNIAMLKTSHLLYYLAMLKTLHLLYYLAMLKTSRQLYNLAMLKTSHQLYNPAMLKTSRQLYNLAMLKTSHQLYNQFFLPYTYIRGTELAIPGLVVKCFTTEPSPLTKPCPSITTAYYTCGDGIE